MKGPSSIIFACLISRTTHFIAAAAVAVAAASCVTVVAHANMSGRGDVTSGVSFFAACTYHWHARGEERAEKERKRKERKEGREKENVLAHAYAAVAVVIRVRLRYVVAYTRQMRSRGNTWGARCVSANVGADSDMRNYDRVTRACAHNAVRLAALYRAPRQKHAKYRDKSGVDFRVNDQRWYNGELRVFDSIKKNVSVNTGERQTRRAMRSPECIRKLNALKLKFVFLTRLSIATFISKNYLFCENLLVEVTIKNSWPFQQLVQIASILIFNVSVVREIMCLSEGQSYQTNLRYLTRRTKRRRGHPNLFSHFKE